MAIVASIFTSCGSDDSSDSTPEVICRLNSANYLLEELTSDFSTEEQSTLTVTRNPAGQITRVAENFTQEECEVDVNGNKVNCVTTTGLSQVDLEYSGNEISNITFNEDQLLRAQISYEGGDISNYIRFELNDNGDTIDIDDFRLIYEDGRVVRVDRYDAINTVDDLQLVSTETFEYTGDNITTATLMQPNGDLIEINTYTYDTNPNFLSGDIAYFINEVTFFDLTELPILLSSNNVITIEFDEREGDMDQSTANVTYTYDSNGYPTAINYDESGSDFAFAYDLTAAYECD